MSSRGVNSVTVSGNVGGNFNGGTTGNGVSAFSFMLAVDRRNTGKPVWLRINAYDELAGVCQKKVRKGGYAIVAGELMSRVSAGSQNDLLEVRAEDIVFV